MIFPLHLITEYAHTKPSELDRALEELFGNGPLPKDADPESEEILEGLFGEWLIYEYKQINGSTFIVEFILKNPGRLPQSQLHQFEQIVKTQFYSEFEIGKVKRGEYLEIEDIASGKVYRAYDKSGSSNPPTRGNLRARLAKVDEKWYLVGSNPINLPMTYTDRMKRIIRKEMQGNPFTLKSTVELILHQVKHQQTTPKIPTTKELSAKRTQLEKKYTMASQKFGASLTFSNLLNEIYHEDRANVLNFWKRLTKRGLPEKMLVEELQILQDIWNYFPHHCLGDISPVELYAKLSQAKQKEKKT